MTGMSIDDGDVRELLGLRTAAARILVAAFVVTFAIVLGMTTPPGAAAITAEIAAWAVLSAAAVAFISVPGDPLPVGWTAFIALAGPVGSILVFLVLPVPVSGILQMWPLSAAAALSAYLCVRGRVGSAWASLGGAIGACVGWAVLTGQGGGYGLEVSIINVAPLLMATFFAATIRPAAREIFVMFGRSTEASAAEAAQTALLQERDRQFERIDGLVRPLLEQVAVADELTEQERRACALVEARLRDALRAPVLDVPAVADAALRARTRGGSVVLLDDHGLDGAPDEVLERIYAGVVPALDELTTGVLTVRILPPGRELVATIVREADGRTVRDEYDRDGFLTSAVDSGVLGSPLG